MTPLLPGNPGNLQSSNSKEEEALFMLPVAPGMRPRACSTHEHDAGEHHWRYLAQCEVCVVLKWLDCL